MTQYNILIGQQSGPDFKSAPLDEVIKVLEENTDLIFNYDPQAISEYSFSGSLNYSIPQSCISQILYDTPFVFSDNAGSILIYKPEAKPYRICATVRDAESKDLLIGVNVSAENTILGTQTDEDGFFEFSMTTYKNQKISFSYIGYKTTTRQIQELVSEECGELELMLDDQLWSKEIVITDYILDGISEENEYNGYVMDYGQLSKHHSIVEHDILKTAQLLPGISSLDESATNLQIRGGTADQNLILWEGAPIYQPGHIFGMISAINPFSIDNVDIHKGVHDPKYDNRVGGIIDISLTDSIEQSRHGSVGMTLTEAHFNLDVPIIDEKLEVFLSGRQSMNRLFNSSPLQNYTNKVFQLSKIDDQSAGAEDGSVLAEQELNFYDWNAKLLYKPVDRALINVSYYTNSQNFEYSFSYPDDPFNALDKIGANTEALKTEIDWEFNNKWTSSFSYMLSNYNSKYIYEEEELGQILTDYSQDNDITDQSIVWSNAFKIATLELNAGYDYNIKELNYNVVNDKIDEPYFEDTNFEKGRFHNLFTSMKWNRNKFNVSGGLRATYYVEQDRWVSSPRFSLQYFVNSKFKIKTEGGIFYQFVSQLRDFGNNSIAVDSPLWVLNDGNADLSQRAKKLAAGFNYHNKGWLIDLEAFYNHTDGLSTLSPIFNLLTNVGFSRGSSEAIGLGLVVKKRWTNFNTWMNYSLGQIDYSFPDYIEGTFVAPNNIKHALTLVGSYQYRDFQFSLISNFHSGLPFTRPIGVEDIYDEEDDETYYVVDYDKINEERLRAYARLDLSINYRPDFNLIGNSKMELSLSILNILNRQNVFAREYYLDYQEEEEIPTLASVRKSLLQRMPLVMCRVYW